LSILQSAQRALGRTHLTTRRRHSDDGHAFLNDCHRQKPPKICGR
jgi:hypothetical protein